MSELNKRSGGVRLPQLTKPASAAKILSGFQALNGDGKLLTGTYDAPVCGLKTLTSGAWSLSLPELKGKQYVIAVGTNGVTAIYMPKALGIQVVAETMRTGCSWNASTGVFTMTPWAIGLTVYFVGWNEA